MTQNRLISIEGVTCSGKTTLINRLRAQFPEAAFLPDLKEKILFKRFVEKHSLDLNPPKDYESQGNNFAMFLEYEKSKNARIKELLGDSDVYVGRDYLSFYSATYAYGVVFNTGFEEILPEQIKKLNLGVFRMPDIRVVLSVDPPEAIRRRTLRGRNEWTSYDSEGELLDYLTVKQGFLLDYVHNVEPENSVVIDSNRTPDRVFQDALEVLAQSVAIYNTPESRKTTAF